MASKIIMLKVCEEKNVIFLVYGEGKPICRIDQLVIIQSLEHLRFERSRDFTVFDEMEQSFEDLLKFAAAHVPDALPSVSEPDRVSGAPAAILLAGLVKLEDKKIPMPVSSKKPEIN